MNKKDLTACGLHREPPPAWDLSCLKLAKVTIPEKVSVFESFGNNCSETSNLQIIGTINYTDSKFFDTVYHPHFDYFGKIDYWEDTEKGILILFLIYLKL